MLRSIPKLLAMVGVTPPGRVLVQVELDDDLSAYQLPAGVKAYIAVYSDTWKPVAIIRKVILRVQSWENYLFSFTVYTVSLRLGRTCRRVVEKPVMANSPELYRQIFRRSS